MVKKTVNEFIEIALDLHKNSSFEHALKIYDQLIDAGVVNANVFNLKALCCKSLKRFEIAEEAALRAVELSSRKNAYFLNTYAMILKDLKRYEEAKLTFNEVLKLDNTNAEYVNNAANVFFELERFGAAEHLYRKALELDKKITVSYENIASIMLRFKKYDEVEKIITEATQYGIASEILLYNRISALVKEEKIEIAKQYYQTLYENYGPTPYYCRAKIKILMADGLDSDLSDYLDSMNFKALDEAVKIMYAYALQYLGQLKRAKRALLQIIKDHGHQLSKANKATVRWTLACIQMKSAELPAAWKDFYHRVDWEDFPSETRDIQVPRLARISDLKSADTLMICREQGVGDEMMYFGLVPKLLEKYTGTVILEVTDRLLPLFERSFPSCQVRPVDFDTETRGVPKFNDYDKYAYVADIPGLLGFTPKKMKPVPYMKADDVKVQYWKNELEHRSCGRQIIGLSWRSSKLDEDRIIHYTKLSEWEKLLNSDKYFVVSLQYGDVEADVADLEGREKIFIPDVDLYNDFDSIAAIMMNCVTVVAPFNAVLMQAGCLNRPTISYLHRGDTFALGQDRGKTEFRYPWLNNNHTFLFEGEIERSACVQKILNKLQLA